MKNDETVAVINDGVSIASDIQLENTAEQVGAKLLLQACSKTDSRAGDGTTTAAVLTQALVRKGNRLVAAGGINSVAVQRGLIKVANFFVNKIRDAAEPVTTLEQYASIATISSGSPDMGEKVAEAVMRVGYDGSTTTEAHEDFVDVVEFAEGLEHEVGYCDPAFIKELETSTATLEKPRVLVTDANIGIMQDFLPILEGIVKANEPLLVFCPKLYGEAIAGMKLNKNRGVLDVCVVTTPGFGDLRDQYLEDICAFSGATYIDSKIGRKLADMTIDDLGSVERAVVSKGKTTLISNGKYDDAVEKRVQMLKGLIETKLAEGKEFEIQRLEQRIQKLRGCVARIKIGGNTEAEIEDKRLRYEDAINALKGGISEGMVPGGGACYAYMLRYEDEARALFDLESQLGRDESVAVDIMLEAMKEPIRQISSNAGEFGELVLRTVMNQEWGYGFNAKTLEYEDLFAAGVCDPASVTTWALDNAASIAGSLLTTEALVCLKQAPIDESLGYRPEFTTGIQQEEAGNLAW
jgi:chaperonin GroEL